VRQAGVDGVCLPRLYCFEFRQRRLFEWDGGSDLPCGELIVIKNDDDFLFI
jgi:hypothetical protein